MDQTAIFTSCGVQLWSQVQSNLVKIFSRVFPPQKALLTFLKDIHISVTGCEGERNKTYLNTDHQEIITN